MSMKVVCKKIDVSLEKRILIGFIVSTDFIKNIIRIYNKDYFSSHSSRLIAKWCVEYYKKHESAPNKHIADIYLINKRKNTLEDEDIDFIDDLLSSLSDEWEQTESTFNPKQLIEQCVHFFNEKKLLSLHDKVNQYIEDKDFAAASDEMQNFKPLQISVNAEYINPFSDEDEVTKAFEENLETVFKLPGELGKLLNPHLYKGGLISFQAPEKSGKSFILQELVMRALRTRKKVAVFELGDMTKGDRIRRIGSYIAKLPFSREKIDDGFKKCRIPELIENDGEYTIKFNEVVLPILTAGEALRQGKKWIKRCGKDTFRVSIHPSDTTSMADIQEILEIWRDADNWVPEFIAIDYPDIAKVERSGLDIREAVNIRWKAMRRMSQEWDALVAAVTQANAASYGKRVQGRDNFSEDKRKHSHVTGTFTINQTPQERSQNIIRIGAVQVREGDINLNKHVAVVHCLDIGRPYMFSYPVDVTGFNDEEDN